MIGMFVLVFVQLDVSDISRNETFVWRSLKKVLAEVKDCDNISAVVRVSIKFNKDGRKIKLAE